MFDLQVITERVDDQIVLDQPRNKRRPPIRITEIHARAGALDYVPADNPIPRRAFGGNANRLLIIAMPTYAQSLQRNVVRPVCMAFALDTIHRQTPAIKFHIA